MERWKSVRGYEGHYEVSSYGRVRSLDRNLLVNDRFMHLCSEKRKGKELSQENLRAGYKRVSLNKNGVSTRKVVHRLVAEAFIPNPDSKPYVNHINGNKSDNRVENLEWCTAKENTHHSMYVLKNDCNFTKKRPIKCLETGEVFESVTDAQRRYGSGTHIWDAAAGKRNIAAGFHWQFVPKDRTPLYAKEKMAIKVKRDIRSPIRCVETGREFESVKSAAEWAKIAICTLCNALVGRTETAAHYHWEYIKK